MGNAFMASAEKSKRKQADIERSTSTADDELVVISVRIPESLRRAAQLHRLETGENMTKLIERLLSEELG